MSALLTQETSAGERELVHYLPQVLEAHRQLNGSQQKAIVDCLKIMTRGMHELQRDVSLSGLKTRQDLDRYCVAGIVGEMLTDFFIDFDSALAAQRGVCWLSRDLLKLALQGSLPC